MGMLLTQSVMNVGILCINNIIQSTNIAQNVEQRCGIMRGEDMKIGDEIYIHGYVDEIRKDVVIVKNGGGYFGTIPTEIITTEDDCISRKDAVDACLNGWNKDYKEILSDLQTMPTVQPQTGWIPVENELPDEWETVLVWYEHFVDGEFGDEVNQTYGLAYNSVNDGWTVMSEYQRGARVIAWMPLPHYPNKNDIKR